MTQIWVIRQYGIACFSHWLLTKRWNAQAVWLISRPIPPKVAKLSCVLSSNHIILLIVPNVTQFSPKLPNLPKSCLIYPKVAQFTQKLPNCPQRYPIFPKVAQFTQKLPNLSKSCLKSS